MAMIIFRRLFDGAGAGAEDGDAAAVGEAETAGGEADADAAAAVSLARAELMISTAEPAAPMKLFSGLVSVSVSCPQTTDEAERMMAP